MGSVTRTKLMSIMALCAMIGLLLMPILVAIPALADGGAPAADGKKEGGEAKVEKGKDVYYKTEGIVSGPPAPKTTDSEKDYPRYNFESRVLLWFANQQHLYYGSFVLAVPIFCMIIEFMGVVSKDKALAKRYDQLAYDFIKISLTAYSLTAILGGILIFTFLTLYPAFFQYLSGIFRPVMHIYALMFVAESGTLYIYYYGWDKMKEGFLKWIHLSMSVVLNVIGTILMFLANSWIGFMMSPAGVDEQGRYLGNIWHVIHTALWNPLNLHRILGNMAFGGGVVAAYAAYRFLSAKTDEERAHYDWMGYVGNFIGVFGLLPLPFAGYYFNGNAIDVTAEPTEGYVFDHWGYSEDDTTSAELHWKRSFHSDGTVRAIPMDTRFLPRPEMGFTIDAVFSNGIRGATCFGITPTQDTPAATGVKADDKAIFFFGNLYITTATRTAEMSTAHPFDG